MRDINGTWMDGACGAGRGEGKCVEGFVGSARKESDNLEELPVDGSVISVQCCVRRIDSGTVMGENYKKTIFFK